MYDDRKLEKEIEQAKAKEQALGERIKLLSQHQEWIGTTPAPKVLRKGLWFRPYKVCPLCESKLQKLTLDDTFGHINYGKCTKCDYEWASKWISNTLGYF
jgi:hypothetical protein